MDFLISPRLDFVRERGLLWTVGFSDLVGM